MYVNHRPAFGLSPSQLGKAFKVLGERHGDSQKWTVDRATLLTLLQERGIFMMVPSVIHKCLLL